MHTFSFTLPDGDKNKGTVYLPHGTTAHAPALIYCHAWGGNRELRPPMDSIVARAMQEGMAVIAFDFFGSGETDGDMSEMTYTRWKDNLCAVWNWTTTQSFADSARIGCYAFSSGSTAVLRLAAEMDGLAFLISVGTCITANIAMNSGGPARLLVENLPHLQVGGTVPVLGVDFGLAFYLDTVRHAPVYTIKNIKCPVLFLQGTDDNIYRITDAYIAHHILQQNGLSSRHIEIEDGSHGLENKADEVVRHVFEFIAHTEITPHIPYQKGV